MAAAESGNGGSGTGVGGTGGGNTDLRRCVSTFFQVLVAPHGRIDGTLVAIVRPQDQKCSMPNSHHLILEIMMRGANYRMLIRVASTMGGDPRVQLAELGVALPRA
jgi:hypothetical protein